MWKEIENLKFELSKTYKIKGVMNSNEETFVLRGESLKDGNEYAIKVCTLFKYI